MNKNEFRVIIAGGRDFNDYELLKKKLDNLLRLKRKSSEITIVCGKARGADSLGEKYAIEHGFKIAEYPAQWDKHGLSAGYKRNLVMAQNADALVAFWDGKSKGTSHMIKLAKKMKLDYRIINYNHEK